MPIRAIFFDAVGTLIHPEPAAAEVYAEAGRRFGSRYSAETIARRFAQAFQKQEAIDRELGWITNEQRECQRWRDIVGEVFDDVTDPAQVFDDLYGHFARPSSWRCEPGVEILCEELLDRGYQLGLASNFDGRLHGLVHGLEPLRAIAAGRGGNPPLIVISSEVGFRKPAAEFYQAMCRRAGLEAANILHIGDDPENDYAGARASGMRALLFDARANGGVLAGRVAEYLSEM